MLFFLNVYSLISWIGRLGIYKKQHRFIKSRLVRTSREEIPRFLFDFEHCERVRYVYNEHCERFGYVYNELVRTFIMKYLKPDGYFFIRMLTVNVSDFVVQEILEQLWALYIDKYGEQDATEVEKTFDSFRKQTSRSSSASRTPSPMLDVFDEQCGAHDAKRQYMKRYSHVGAELSTQATGVLEPLSSSIRKQNEQV
jgi:hypothetical protein